MGEEQVFSEGGGRVSSGHSEVRPLVIQVKMSSQQVDLIASLDAFMNLPLPFHVE